MEPENTYEQEIDLKDLMFAVLHKWRPIIVTAVIFAVLLGGFKGVVLIRVTAMRTSRQRHRTCISRIWRFTRPVRQLMKGRLTTLPMTFRSSRNTWKIQSS
mgnify:CR=1 FL=1